MSRSTHETNVEAPGDGDRGGASGTIGTVTFASTDGGYQEPSRDTLTDGHVLRFRVTALPRADLEAIASACIGFRDGFHTDGRPYRGGDITEALRRAGL